MYHIYEDRSEMQRSLRKANIREVYIRARDGKIRVTVALDSRSLAVFETDETKNGVADEIANWRDQHFEVTRGEVMTERAGRRDGVG